MSHDHKSLCATCNYYDLTFKAQHREGCPSRKPTLEQYRGALAGVADPAALVASHAEMLERLENGPTIIGGPEDLAIIERARRAKGAP
jgi:hypothetical protein